MTDLARTAVRTVGGYPNMNDECMLAVYRQQGDDASAEDARRVALKISTAPKWQGHLADEARLLQKLQDNMDDILARSGTDYDPEAVRLFLKVSNLAQLPKQVREITLHELEAGMVLANGIFSPHGLLLIACELGVSRLHRTGRFLSLGSG